MLHFYHLGYPISKFSSLLGIRKGRAGSWEENLKESQDHDIQVVSSPNSRDTTLLEGPGHPFR